MFARKSKKLVTPRINLVPKDPFLQSVPGRVLSWMLSVGRHVVIFTEMIVIISFAGRFYLDRKITDLNSEIFQKEVRIDGLQEVEQQARLAQFKIDQYDQVRQTRNPVDMFPLVAQTIPTNIVLDKMSIKADRVVLTGVAKSQNAFNILIGNLQLTPDFIDVVVQSVEADESTGAGYNFSITATTQVTKQKAAPAQAVEQKVDLLDRTQGL